MDGRGGKKIKTGEYKVTCLVKSHLRKKYTEDKIQVSRQLDRSQKKVKNKIESIRDKNRECRRNKKGRVNGGNKGWTSEGK